MSRQLVKLVRLLVMPGLNKKKRSITSERSQPILTAVHKTVTKVTLFLDSFTNCCETRLEINIKSPQEPHTVIHLVNIHAVHKSKVFTDNGTTRAISA